MVAPKDHRRRLLLETLESRLAPATFTVLNDANAGAGSLRQAVLDANGHSGADLIDFSSYFNSPRTITLAGVISITDAVTIDGTSAANVTISGNDFYGIFNTGPAPAGTAISFVDLTLRQGRITDSGVGGGISAVDEAISATRCVFTRNFSNSGGGAIGIFGIGSLTANDCTFTENSAGNDGGGAVVSRTAGSNVVLRRCQIAANSSESYNPLSGGGGVRVAGSFLLEDSTVSGNTAYSVDNYSGAAFGYGGGINILNGNLATIRNSTISGNRAGFALSGDPRSYGGGMYIGMGALVVQNSTIADNLVGLGEGGGIWATTVSLESCVVAGNGNSGYFGSDIRASTVNARTSSIFNRTGAITFNDLGGNRPAGEDPRLGPLQNNGGPTQTHALLAGSPCVDAGSNPANLNADQRGPGFPRALNGTTDMGAYEGVYPIPIATPIGIPPTITSPGGTSYTVVVRYDDDIGIDLATIDLGDITVTGPGYAVPQAPIARSISGSGQVVTVTYTLPAPGGTFDFYDDGQYTVAIVGNQVRDTDTPAPHFVPPGALGTFRVAITGTLVVDEPTDIEDGNTTHGHLSLREAIRLTNTAIGTSDTITFDPAVFDAPRTITLTAGQFAISDPLAIIGPGAGLLTLSAASVSRHFNIYVVTNSGVTLSGLTLINGLDSITYGGAIAAAGALTLSDIAISNCQAYNGGGAVFAQGSFTMRDCVISNNRVSGDGGGILVSESSGGAVVLERCSFVNNQAAATGGGMFIAINGLLQISECTVSGNQASTQMGGSSGGGGAFVTGTVDPGSVIRNSTVSGNVAANASRGGGLGLTVYGALPIANSTITGNSTTGTGGGVAVSSGYYANFVNLNLDSAIIAGNSAGNAAGSGPDLWFSATFLIPVTGRNSLLGVADSGNFSLTGAGNLTGTLAAPLNPMLGPLADNGGPTKTHALLASSPALNAGNNFAALLTDQRGAGYLRVVGPAADIGAFEVQAPRIASVIVNDGSVQRSRVTSLTVTFSTQVTFAGTVASAFTLTRNGGGAVNFSATASIIGGATVVTLTGFTGNETQFGSLKDGRYTLTALASQISANGQQMASDFTFGDAQGLFRFFGDINGDRHVDIADFGLFSSAFNLSTGQTGFIAALDFNGDGHIDIADFGQFSVRFFTPLP
jgi:hypothetical protein